MKKELAKNAYVGINETYPHKSYDENGFLIKRIALGNSVESEKVNLEDTIRKEVLRRYKSGIINPPTKIVYILPYTDQEKAIARFIVVDGNNKNIEKNYPIEKVEEIEELLKDLFPKGIARQKGTWVEIYTTKDHIFSKKLEYRERPLMDIVKEIIQYDSNDEKRHLDKIAYELKKVISISR